MAAVSKGDFELYIEQGPERGRFIPLKRETIRIGRRSRETRTADIIFLNDPTLSAHHATLYWESERGCFRLIHESQTNATVVNGRSAEDVFLHPNDTIKMGRVVLRLLVRQSIGSRLTYRRQMRQALSLGAEQRILFFHNLGVMLSCGLSMTRSLEAQARQAEDPRWQILLNKVLDMVNNGAPLSVAMAAHSPPFASSELALVRAGETSGRLPEVLRTTAEARQKDLELVRQVRSALTYPMVVMVFGILMILLLGRVAFSALVPMLQGTGTPLPLITKILILVSGALGNPLVVVPFVAVVVGAGTSARRYLRTAQGIAWRDRVTLDVPLVGPLLVKVAAARYCYSLSQLYGSGLAITTAYHEAARACGNVHLTARLDTLAARLKEGQALSDCLQQAHLMPPTMLSLIQVGETSGKLDDMLKRAATMMDEDVRTTLDQAAKALEPITLAVMGFLVGFILLAAFVPIYSVVAKL